MLANPDIDINVFRQQISRIDPGHVSLYVARNDRALNLSSRIAGARPRLGAMDPEKPEDKAELDRLGVSVRDISSFSTDFIGHGAFAEAPNVVRGIGASITAPRAQDANTQAVPDFRGQDTGDASPSAPPPGARQKVETSPLPPVAER
jgi:esterase/lipase superfamily enzyme